MRVLLSFLSMTSFGGTETYILTVAQELQKLGHDVTIYAPERGAMAEHARREGARVVGLTQLETDSFDLLIANDTATLHELTGRFRSAIRLFVAHSTDFALVMPTRSQDQLNAVIVLNDRVRKTVEARPVQAPVVRLRQPIDLLRFSGWPSSEGGGRDALLLSNYVQGPRAELIQEACAQSGWRLSWVGATSEPTPFPEVALAGVDAVIGLGRGALEGMAAGRAAYVYGVVGGDGWVTPERYPSMEADGFAGTGYPKQVLRADELAADLRRYESTMGEVGRDLASAHHGARVHAEALIELARSFGAVEPPGPDLYQELAHLVRSQRVTELRAGHWLAEMQRLSVAEGGSRAQLEVETRARTDAESAVRELLERLRAVEAARELLRAELGVAHAGAEQGRLAAEVLAAKLQAILATRRYRLAQAAAAPLDRTRQLRRRLENRC